MKRIILITSLVFVSVLMFGQTGKRQYLGINIMQLPAFTINANFSQDIAPYFTALGDAGYAVNYKKAMNLDLPGTLLTAHEKLDDVTDIEMIEYHFYNMAGGYVKAGGYFNMRNNFEKRHFFHLGLFTTYALVYERADKQILYPVTEEPYLVEHAFFTAGLAFAGGYEFSVSKRLKSQVDLQYSLPVVNQDKPYIFRSFIPGMGFKDNTRRFYPMLIWNVKYQL
jgi:hypothetical protein